MERILLIAGLDEAHPFHRAVGQALGADTYITNFNRPLLPGTVGKAISMLKSALFIPRGYDIYLSETVFVIPALAKRLGIISKDAVIINISADPVLYNIVRNGDRLTLYDKIHKYFINDVDGFVIEGEWTFLFKKLGINKPSFEVYAGVEDARLKQLLSIRIESKPYNHNIVFVGYVIPSRMEYKGVDLLLKAYRKVRKTYPDARLYIMGRSELDIRDDGVIFAGLKSGKEFADFLRDMSIAANLGRGDTFPVGTIEAMASGVPALVSEFTGTKVIVRKADKDFILPLDSDRLAASIIKYFGLSRAERIRTEKKFREAARNYSSSDTLRKFKRDFKVLLERIRSEKLKS